jgi:hypothetical protein
MRAAPLAPQNLHNRPMDDIKRDVRRFKTEREARRFAQRESAKHGDVRYVVESPHPEHTADDRFVVDTDRQLARARRRLRRRLLATPQRP